MDAAHKPSPPLFWHKVSRIFVFQGKSPPATPLHTIVLDGYSEEDVNGRSPQGVCETAQESAIRNNT